MKIIIVGISSVGEALLKTLSLNPQIDITVIDTNKDEVEKATEQYNVNGLCGSGSSRTILIKAGIYSCDVLIALTPIDEVNITSSIIAKSCGVKYTCAIIQSMDFLDDIDYLNKKIDYIINPKIAISDEVFLQIGLPGKMKIDAVFDNNAVMIKTMILNDYFLNKSMTEINDYFDGKVLIGAVRRNKDIFIPNGTFSFNDGDEIEIICEKEYLPNVILKLNLPLIDVKNVMIIGCGSTGYFVAKEILKKKMNLKIIDNDLKRCKELTELFPNTEVLYINDASKLMQQNLKNIDVAIMLANQDDSNIVHALYAWKEGVKSIIMRVNSLQYETLLNKTEFQISVSPVSITVDRILTFIRNIFSYNMFGDDIKQIRLIFNSMVETIEFVAYENCKVLNIPFSADKFKIKKNVLIAIIIRDGKTIIPNGKSVIKSNDRVIVITKKGGKYNTLNDIFD